MGSRGPPPQRRKRTEFQPPQAPVHDSPASVVFAPFSAAEVKALSVVNVVNPESFNQLGHPNQGGLYDLRMGPFTDRNDVACATCLLRAEHCPGHLGHIELPLPVVNPLYMGEVLQALKLSCFYCHRLRVPEYAKELMLTQQKLLDRGLIIAAQQAEDVADVDLLDFGDEEGKKRVKRVDGVGVVDKLKRFFEEEVDRDEKEMAELALAKECEVETRNVQELKKRYRKAFVRAAKGGAGACRHCGERTRAIKKYKAKIILDGTKQDGDGDRRKSVKSKRELNPRELIGHFRQLWGHEPEVLCHLFPALRRVLDANSRGLHPETLTQIDDDEEDRARVEAMPCPTDIFFTEVLAVPPPKTRPCLFAAGVMTIHPQSSGLQSVVETGATLRELVRIARSGKADDLDSLTSEARDMVLATRGDKLEAKISSVWSELQSDVNQVVDRDLKTDVAAKKQGYGFKQLIERKTGLFRMHMMGKRVNFAARTVITPDPNIGVDEIGLPEVFARSLTYREPVTPYNVDLLRDMVLNGPDVHPGAAAVEFEDGAVKMVDGSNPTQREALAKTLFTAHRGEGVAGTRFVHRHLLTGDAMLLNRQPTLHKPSIMSHRARVLKGEKVMRLHYAICKSYNADFDGDEMNAHFPQNEVARSEAYNIVNVCKQYLVPKDGTPLQGLIQDHIISGVKMTMRGRFFTREQYFGHVYGALVDHPGAIRTVPPAILKPERLWSGKQIISTIVLNLVPEGKKPPTLESTAKVKPNLFEKVPPRHCEAGGERLGRTQMSESEVIFRQGEFLCGILDKNQYGATQYGLVHAFFELYGGDYSGKLISAFSKVFTNFLHTEGFTLGVQDILVREEANKKRRKIMRRTRKQGDEMAAKGVGMNAEEEEVDEDELRERLEMYHRESRKIPKRRMDIDRAYKHFLAPATDDVNSECLPKGLVRQFPENNLQLMVQAGAKGSMVNTMQISSLLGQIELEGKRPPLMISGKSLPSFAPYDTRPRAGGFIDGRFMTGIRPQEFFFHCMAGREGLIDTAVKTSRSGYLQRCLIKLLEGLVVNYDLTVRDSDGSVVQFQYGEDSLDVCKSQYLKGPRMDFLVENRDSIMSDGRAVSLARRYTDAEGLGRHKAGVGAARKRVAARKGKRDGGFLRYSKDRIQEMETDPQSLKPHLHQELKNSIVDEWRGMEGGRARSDYEDESKGVPDPALSRFRPDSNFGSVSEKVEKMIDDYLGKRHSGLNVEPESFKEMVYLKSLRAMIDPGEPVGVLAAQSVGEPSTQMTLNTFHFAGRGDMNVTLGIPRLREILMVASENIKTPSMTIPFLPHVSKKKREAFRISLNRVTMGDVVQKVHVREKVITSEGQRGRLYKIRFEFLPRWQYRDQFAVTPASILHYFENKFIHKVLVPVLNATVKDRMKKVVVESFEDDPSKQRPAAARQTAEGDSEDRGGAEAERRMDQLDRQGEGHASSDEEDAAEDADASEARLRRRREDDGGDRGEEALSDEEEEIVRELAKRLAAEERKAEEEDEDDFDGLESVAASTRSVAGSGASSNNTRQDTTTPSIELDLEEGDEGFGELSDQEVYDPVPPPPPSEAQQPAERQKQPEDAAMEASEEATKRKATVMNLISTARSCATIFNYAYDVEKELWAEVTLIFGVGRRPVDMSNVVRKACEKAVIKQVPNIKRAFLVNEKNEEVVTTEGINLVAAFEFDRVLDLRRLRCNNIHEMARRFGVESANRTIVSELVSVFSAYGIHIDARHLTLIADYMTFDGTYRPFNRVGMEDNPSPLQQMTFETATNFLRAAALGGKKDSLRSPSARIVVGKPCAGGTGAFKLVHDLNANAVVGMDFGKQNKAGSARKNKIKRL